MEVGSGVKNFKAGDKVVSILSHLVSFFSYTYKSFSIKVVVVITPRK